MRRFTPTHMILVSLTAAFAIGWTAGDRPTGDTTTVQRGDVVYVDKGSTIQIYRVDNSAYELVTSIETDPQATHDGRRSRHKKHSHGVFSCSCTHTHDQGDGRHDHGDPQDEAQSSSPSKFVAGDSTLSYVYDNSTVVTLDISTPDEPREISRVTVEWMIKTIEVIEATVIIGGDEGRFALGAHNATDVLRKIE